MDEKVCVEITREGPVAVVEFKAPSISSIEGVNTISEQINKFIQEHHPRKMIIDFGGVKFFSSQVLGILLDTRAKLEKYNGELVISAIVPHLHRVFRITNLDKVFRFFPDKESAVEVMCSDGVD